MRQQRDPRLDTEHPDLFGRQDRQVRDLFSSRVRVDMGVTDEPGAGLVGHHRHRAERGTALTHAEHLGYVLQLFLVAPDDTADQCICLTTQHHDRGDHGVAGPHDGLGRVGRHTAALGDLVESLPVLLEARIGLRIDQFEMLADTQPQTGALDAHLDHRRPTDQNRPGQAVVDDGLDRAQHGLFLAFGEYHPLRIAPRGVKHRLHQQAGAEHILSETLAVGFEILDRPGRHTGLHRRLRHRRCQLNQQTRVERLRNQMVRPELQILTLGTLGDHIGSLHPRQLGNRMDTGHLHLVVDRGRADIERAAEDVGEAQHVVDLVRKVRAPGGDQRIRTDFTRQVGHDLWHRVGQRQNQRPLGHALDHLGLEHPARRNAEKNVGLRNHLVQGTGVGFDRVTGLARVHIDRAAGVDHALAIADHDVFHLQAELDQQVKAGHAGRTGAGGYKAHLLDLLSGQLQCVDHGRGSDDGSAVLVVVKHRDLHPTLQRFLDVEALRRLDIFEIDAAEGRLEAGNDLDQPFRIPFVDLDIEYIDVGELLEQYCLAFHHRLGRQRADVAQPQHRGTIGDHPDEVAPGGVLSHRDRVGDDRVGSSGHSRRVGQRQVLLRGQHLGRRDLDLAGRGITMVVQRFLVEFVGHSGCLRFAGRASDGRGPV